MRVARPAAALLALAAVVFGASPVGAYDFEIGATTIGQGYQLRWFRFSERDRLLNRRRFTQSLRLHIWNILEPPVDPAFPDKRRKAPFDLYFTTSMRFDHDFGSYASGDTRYPLGGMTIVEDAIDAFPDLANQHMELDVLYAYVGGRRLFGFLDFQLGRQLTVDTLDWYSFDGLHLRVRTPWWFALETHGGLGVRSSSLFGSPTHEPDGTSTSGCMVFDEGDLRWATGADSECEQRDRLMPTFGFAAETYGRRNLQARVSYRRAFSRTDFDVYPDAGSPTWGVNEEKLMASVRGNFAQGGVVPWVAARWNFLFGQIDEANAGLRLAWAQHAITPEAIYSMPSFDGDSIFNVFSTEPYRDLRVTWDVWPGRGRLRAYARGWLRLFDHSDEGRLASGEKVESENRTTGAGVGARLRFPDRGFARLDLFWEDGYGGLRAGGDVSARWRLRRDLSLEGRVSVIRFDEDSLEGLHATTFGAQGGGRWILGEGIALHLLAEENINRFHASEFRLMGLLDLAFQPEI